NSTCLGLKKKYRLSLKNDMPPRDKSVENELPATVFNDSLTSNETLSCKPTKIISTNDLKTDLENDNEKFNMPLFPSPEPKVSCIDDLDFFKDFKNEFPAIVYNDALTSKSYFSTVPTLYPQHINEFDVKDDTSLTKYDEEEQNILYFNNLFLFNIIYPDDLKLDKGNGDNEIDMIQSSGVEGYTKEIVYDFEKRLEMMFGRHVNRVHILDFKGLTSDMRKDLAERLRMVYTRDDGQDVFAPKKVSTIDLLYLRSMDRGAAKVPYLLALYLFMHTEGRKSDDRLPGGYFIRRLAHHFGLVSDDGLRGLFVVSHEIPLIDMGELVKLNISRKIGDDWACVALGPKRQHDDMAGTPEAAEDAYAVDEGAQVDPAPIQAPQLPPPTPTA
nr:hypothetical protein [Tanacetum cinerariifolium]